MNKKNTKFNYGWVILTILCLGLALANYSQYQVSAFGTQITAEMNLSATQFSTIATGPLIPGIFLSLVSGLLAWAAPVWQMTLCRSGRTAPAGSISLAAALASLTTQFYQLA
ncbi:MAG: hypothetical protein IJC91_03570, partial [Oscillospiraceae bacterium]|nr:hypothetical protein [Oscillospiraceae bacterium]